MAALQSCMRLLRRAVLTAVSTAVLCATAFADSGIRFDDVTAQLGPSLSSYRRVGSTTATLTEDLLQRSLSAPVTQAEVVAAPTTPRGLPGVAILDYDRDGDLDIYVTNGPGAPNRLFHNQLMENGALSFVDRAAQAGVEATDQDSFGVCYGDIDNDGDADLMVLGRKEPNRLFVNQGNGTFLPLANDSASGDDRTSSSCSMGDVNNDGLLDIVVANAFDITQGLAIFTEPLAFNEPNQLLINQGGHLFVDVSESSGITVNLGYPTGAAGISWAVAIADVNRDGNADIIFADDQGAISTERLGGVDRGYIQVFLGEGSGQFTGQPIILDAFSAGAWMGIAVGDLNCDGNLDLFGSNFGDYGMPALQFPYLAPASTSRPFFGNGDGTFADPGLGFGLKATPFGWGNAIFDYDNDGDNDILFHGGLDATMLMISDNPGALLENQGCTGIFTPNTTAMTTDHLRRSVRGVAVGDLDRNGFVDIVTVANVLIPEETQLIPSPVQYDAIYDTTAFFAPVLDVVGTAEQGPLFRWNGFTPQPGDLKLELNRGNDNHWVRLDVLGAIGLTSNGTVNRDGIGTQLSFTPDNGPTTMQAVVGGSSHLSQHALSKIFGLGQGMSGTVEILWPGGVRNRLYGVSHGETLTLPEIPCSFDADWPSLEAYQSCVETALDQLVDAGVISSTEVRERFLTSAIRVFQE